MKNIRKIEYAVLATILLLCLSSFTPHRLIKVNPTDTSIQENKLKNSALPVVNYPMSPGHPYNWIDASGGTELLLGDDDSATISLPFDFTFYNETFSTVYLCSNGYLSFTDTDPWDYNNVPFPSADPLHTYMLAPFWDDIDTYYGGNIYVQSFGTYWVAEWLNIYHNSGNLIGSFEVILCDSGEIVFNYDYLDYMDPDDGYTCGLNLGVDIDYYNSYEGLNDLTDDFSIQFTYELQDHDLRVSLEVPDIPKMFETFTINATATNTGKNAETGVDLYLYLDNVIVESITDYSLSIGESVTINYEWTPTEFKLYNFTTYAPPVSGESTFYNNYVTKILFININYTMFPGHPYNWIDASGGTELFLGDDDYAAIALPFNFTFYDQTFSTVYLCSNGYLSFTDTMPEEYDNVPFPSEDPHHRYMIAPFWDDITASYGGHIYNQSFGTYWVAAWVDIYHNSNNLIGSFEVVLYNTGDIVFNYGYLNYTDPDNGYTCGLNLGVDKRHYNSYQGLDNTTDDFAIRFSPDALFIASPDSSSLWITGTSEDINWASTGTISNVKIELFKEGAFEMEIIASTANDGEYTWTIPSGLNDSTQYQIKISDASDPLTYDYSPNFEIFTPTITILTPDSSSVWKIGTSQNINWTSTGNISNVKIELYKEGVLELEIVASTDNDGNFIWTVPKELKTSDQYQVKIIDESNSTIFALSDYFKIKKPPGAIPGYSVYILIGIVSVVSVILFKKRLKLIK